MPPQLQALLQNKRLLAIILGSLALIVIILLVALQPWSGGSSNPGKQTLKQDQIVLAEVESVGKGIEVQALLAREGIRVDLEPGDGGKVKVKFNDRATLEERDRAVITLVQSGLMDRNIGLESFDKGDLTASREEKRIKLIRAQQGEMARLIRKIDPIEDASVALSIPEQTIFRSEMKPMSASVQVTLASGDRLGRDKVRAIINLMVGSIQGLDAKHVSLTDTNGNVYNTVLDIGTELNDKLQEQDQYMKQKVSAQLDRLVGAGHYVVSVSTFLREAPKETMVQNFDPAHSAVTTKQNFSERLNAQNGKGGPGGAVSSYIPPGVDASAVSGGGSERGYSRVGTEVAYATGKSQWIETSVPGMIEDISIAVTVDRSHLPGMPAERLQQLLAHAASPKVNPANVTIVETDFERPGLITKAEAIAIEKDMSWIFWAGGAVAAVVLLLVMLSIMRGKPAAAPADQEAMLRNQQELQQLRDFAAQQQAALQATQQQTQALIEAQQQQMLTSRQEEALLQQQSQANELKQTLSELKEAVQEEELEEEDFERQIKTWIESS
jgi:flagellar M-ring protein FliF